MESGAFTSGEREFLFSLAERMTGSCQQGKFRREIIVSNVERRMRDVGISSLSDYVQLAGENAEEAAQLISALTIHTTSWFREVPHFGKIEKRLRDNLAEEGSARIRILCAACSTGEEVYSFALVLEKLRAEMPGLDYQIIGTDIDPVSIDQAKRALYSLSDLKSIPKQYRQFCLIGHGKMRGVFTLAADIRRRCSFLVQDLREPIVAEREKFDVVICRNVLIYFSPEDVDKIVANLVGYLSQEGALCLGHSETIDPKKHHLRFAGNSTYVRRVMHKSMPVEVGVGAKKVLVVDDSLTVRRKLEKLFERNGARPFTVGSADEATEFLRHQQVDLITLDLHMPGTDGATWLRAQRVSGMKVPVVIVSDAAPSEAIAVLGALENGAQDYLEKSLLASDDAAARMLAIAQPPRRVRSDSRLSAIGKGAPVPRKRPDLIVVGASTGGTEVLARMLRRMPADCPPLVVVQHISPQFALPFAERLAKATGLQLGSSIDGVPLESGKIYLAHGDYHVGVTGRQGRLFLSRSDCGVINRHRPSVDFLFQSAAVISGITVSAALMTGMGNDGARGLKALLDSGAVTYAQDESTCVVFGMPKEAIALGAATFVGSPEEIRTQLDRQLAVASTSAISAVMSA